MTDRAGEAWRTLRANAFRRTWSGTVLVRQSHERRSPIAHLWPLSQVLHAAVIVGDVPAVALILGQLERYERHGGLAHRPRAHDRYYDDNAWVGLACAQHVAATGDAGARRRVERSWAFCAQGRQHDGGVAWKDEPHPTVNTCSTAPVALLALRAGTLGIVARAVEVATLAERYLVARLRRNDLLYGDHVRADGTVDPTVHSYNQGSVVALQALLAQEDGERRHLDDAHATAVAALAELRGDRLFAHAPAFNAVFFRGLLLLDAVRPVPEVRRVLDEYLARVWRDARDVRAGTFVDGGIGRYDRATTLDHAGLVQLFALATWPRERCATLC